MQPKALVYLLFLSLSSLSYGQQPKLDAIYANYADLLERYVYDNGVNYDAWHINKPDKKQLAEIVENLGQVRLLSLSRDQQKAFYINLYNAAMIHIVLERYPTSSVTELGPDFSIFKEKLIELGDVMVSLDTIEKEILLKQYPDPRIHFGVNCASISCPALRAEPFRGAILDKQLDEQTKLFAYSKEAAQIKDDTLYISALFDWYRSDFPDNDAVAYINQFRENPLPTYLKRKFLPYNWDLNHSE